MSSKLKKYLGKRGMSYSQFAEKIGVDRTAISHWIRKNRRPNLIHAAMIELETDKAVPVDSWGYEPLSTLPDGSIKLLAHLIESKLYVDGLSRVTGLDQRTVSCALKGTQRPVQATLDSLNRHLPQARQLSAADFEVRRD